MNINNSQFLSNIYNNPNIINNNINLHSNLSEKSFADILNKNENDDDIYGEVKFSKHALTRLEERDIIPTRNQMERLNEGAHKANLKGITDSLVIVDELAFIVNIPNKTVVTAMDKNESEEHVFTNIDGAVIA